MTARSMIFDSQSIKSIKSLIYVFEPRTLCARKIQILPEDSFVRFIPCTTVQIILRYPAVCEDD